MTTLIEKIVGDLGGKRRRQYGARGKALLASVSAIERTEAEDRGTGS